MSTKGEQAISRNVWEATKEEGRKADRRFAAFQKKQGRTILPGRIGNGSFVKVAN